MSNASKSKLAKDLLRDNPNREFTVQEIAQHVGCSAAIASTIIGPQCKEGAYFKRVRRGVYCYTTQEGVEPRPPIRIPEAAPRARTRKGKTTHHIVAFALGQNGGVLSEGYGRAVARLHKMSGFPAGPKALIDVLHAMEEREEVKLLTKDDLFYEIRLTDTGYSAYGLEDMLDIQPEPFDLCPAGDTAGSDVAVLEGGGDVAPAPVDFDAYEREMHEPFVPAAQVIVQEVPVRIDYGELAASCRALLQQEAANVVTGADGLRAEIDDLKERLHRSIEEANTWRNKARGLEQGNGLLQAQLDEVTGKLHTARDELRDMREDRKKLVDVEDMAAIANRTDGWEARQTNGGHWQFSREGEVVAVGAGTASDFRSIKNTRADLRRAGLNV